MTDGFRGFYQGYGIALSGAMVYRALHMGGYDALKTEYLCRKQNIIFNKNVSSDVMELKMYERFAIAQFVSISAGTICYPFDSVRRRLMMQAGGQRLYRNSLHAFHKIFNKEGIQGFYLGLGPNIMRSVGGASLLVSYDAVRFTLTSEVN